MLPLLHIGHELNWSAWHFEPTIISGSIIVAGFYLYGAVRASGGFDWLRALAFYSGALLLFLALVSPLDVAADKALSMHMLQHVALTTLGPPLVLLGLSPAILRPLLQPRPVGAAAKLVTMPLVTAAFFMINMWFWHAPPLYQAALDYTWVHAIMHIAFMASGILFWLPVMRTLPEVTRISDGGRLLYLFVTGMPMGILALLLIASGSVVYSHYETAEGVLGLNPLEDQQVAGVIMGALGELASFVAITILFFRFLDQEEARETATRPSLERPASR